MGLLGPINEVLLTDDSFPDANTRTVSLKHPLTCWTRNLEEATEERMQRAGQLSSYGSCHQDACGSKVQAPPPSRFLQDPQSLRLQPIE